MSKKVPGELSKFEIDGKVDLNKQSIPQLQEIYNRELKLLNNKAFVKKLPDKGSKIQEYIAKVKKAIDHKTQEFEACEMLKKLNLNKSQVDNIEWKNNDSNGKETYLDSDDDSDPEDVLEILSKNTKKQMKIKQEVEDRKLITDEDLKEINELTDAKHVKYILNMTEKNPEKIVERQFKPYKTTVSDALDPSKEMSRLRGKNWEVTAATPPPSVHGPAKQLSIEESLHLQHEQQEHTKRVQAEHAVARLFERSGLRVGDIPSNLGSYREPENEVPSGDSDDEVKIQDDEESYEIEHVT